MKGFILGIIVGAGVFALVGATYPKQTKAAYKSGVDTASTAIAQGTTAASKLADEQMAKNK